MQLDEGEIKEENGFSLENQPTMYTENVFQSSASSFATNKKNQPTQCDDQRLRSDDMESSSRELLQYQKRSTGKGKVMIRTPRMVQQHQHSKTVRIIINKSRILDCALFCCKARRKRLEHERSVGRNTRRSRVFLSTS